MIPNQILKFDLLPSKYYPKHLKCLFRHHKFQFNLSINSVFPIKFKIFQLKSCKFQRKMGLSPKNTPL